MAISGSEVAVDTTATLIVAADARRVALTITNMGPNQIVIGGSGVTLKTGTPLNGTAAPTTAAGGTFSVDTHGGVNEAWYGIARTAQQSTGAATQVVEALRS